MNKFVTVDIETLGTPEDCGTTHIAMPSAAFVVWKGKDVLPSILYMTCNVAEQLFKGAKVSASTIGFWMQEAKTNSAAQEIIGILKGETPGYQIWDNYNDGSWKQCFEASTLYSEVFNYLDSRGYTAYKFYGNGPEFDMTIYSANAHHANGGKPELPWKFWNVESARNIYSSLATKKEAEVWAHNVFKQYNMIATTNHTPSKHNPIFDALVEAYCIANSKEIVVA